MQRVSPFVLPFGRWIESIGGTIVFKKGGDRKISFPLIFFAGGEIPCLKRDRGGVKSEEDGGRGWVHVGSVVALTIPLPSFIFGLKKIGGIRGVDNFLAVFKFLSNGLNFSDNGWGGVDN